MRPTRGTRAFAPRPNMRSIARSPRKPFRVPWEARREEQTMRNAGPPSRPLFPLPRLRGRVGEGALAASQGRGTGPVPNPPPQAGEGMDNRATGGITIEWSRVVLPIVTLALGVVAWDLVVRVKDIPPFILPGPGLVAATVVSDWPVLSDSLLVTLAT